MAQRHIERSAICERYLARLWTLRRGGRPVLCVPALSIKDGYINGYVKPMFSNLEVYNYQKDKNTGVRHQARELVIGGASHLKNSSTQQVATEVNLTGKLTGPGVSTWQAFVQVLHNAFIEAILPGFDRSVRPNVAPDTSRQAHRTCSSLTPPST
jgi:hypothetical protein